MYSEGLVVGVVSIAELLVETRAGSSGFNSPSGPGSESSMPKGLNRCPLFFADPSLPNEDWRDSRLSSRA